MRRRNVVAIAATREPRAAAPERWEVEIGPALIYSHDLAIYTMGGGTTPSNSEIAVRLVKANQRMNYGTIPLLDPEFEDKVTTMKAEAEDRAAALNAVGAC